MPSRRLLVPVLAALALCLVASTSEAGRVTAAVRNMVRPRAANRVAIVTPHSVQVRAGTLQEVARQRKAALESHVLASRTTGHGAAFQEVLIPLPFGAEVRTRSPGQYSTRPHIDKAQDVELTGFQGDVQVVHLGTMSVHDLKRPGGKGYDEATFEQRKSDDRMGLRADGKPLLDRQPSGVVSEHTVTIPRGTARLDYIRQNLNGQTVGGAGGYTMGRVLNLFWGNG